eukprot:m.134011 g.134011  ORF g.134011 m.134011 type:complete len:58 (+) comp29712_c1_seq1:1364-1537(+)
MSAFCVISADMAESVKNDELKDESENHIEYEYGGYDVRIRALFTTDKLLPIHNVQYP